MTSAKTTGPKPNVLIVLVDDLGWSDLACYGTPLIDTPQIDQLAREGLRFTRAYGDPVCAPSRAALHTGNYSARLKLTDVPNGHRRPWAALTPPEIRWQLPPAATTLAEALAPAGYTSAILGKWHLGFRRGFQPEDQGYAVAPTGGLSGPYADELKLWATANRQKGLGTQVVKCARFIERNRDRPFLCIASYAMVHTELEARSELVRKYQDKVARLRTTIDPVYAAMCEAVDESVGWLRRVLRGNGVADNTLILFLSDNGGVIEERAFLPAGWAGLVTHNWPLRGEKGQLFEGGIRIPWIAHWPGHIPAAKVSDVPVHVVDMMPTLQELAGTAGPTHPVDGRSLVPVFMGRGPLESRDLFWHYPHYHHSTPASAVVAGDWKLVHFYETGKAELYHLANDRSEQHDLSLEFPQRALELQSRLVRWLDDVHADRPTPNPWHDPKRAMVWGERVAKEVMADERVPLGIP